MERIQGIGKLLTFSVLNFTSVQCVSGSFSSLHISMMLIIYFLSFTQIGLLRIFCTTKVVDTGKKAYPSFTLLRE